jgi:hypothetical protein
LLLQGDNAPTDVHPHNLRVAGASRTNYSQFLPYPSREMVEHADLYRAMITNFGDLFEWIENVVRYLYYLEIPHWEAEI